MAFHKTGVALTTEVLDSRTAEALTSTTFPADPEVGDVHEGFAWDGGSWVPVEVWMRRQGADQPGEA